MANCPDPLYICPVVKGCTVTSAFSPSRTYNGKTRPHRGVDLRARLGDEIRCVADGKIIKEGKNKEGGYGLYWRIKHEDGSETLYAHLSVKAEGLAVGSLVERGRVIGKSGITGLTGKVKAAHLHFEYWPASVDKSSGNQVDSVPCIATSGPGTGTYGNVEAYREKLEAVDKKKPIPALDIKPIEPLPIHLQPVVVEPVQVLPSKGHTHSKKQSGKRGKAREKKKGKETTKKYLGERCTQVFFTSDCVSSIRCDCKGVPFFKTCEDATGRTCPEHPKSAMEGVFGDDYVDIEYEYVPVMQSDAMPYVNANRLSGNTDPIFAVEFGLLMMCFMAIIGLIMCVCLALTVYAYRRSQNQRKMRTLESPVCV